MIEFFFSMYLDKYKYLLQQVVKKIVLKFTHEKVVFGKGEMESFFTVIPLAHCMSFAPIGVHF